MIIFDRGYIIITCVLIHYYIVNNILAIEFDLIVNSNLSCILLQQ